MHINFEEITPANYRRINALSVAENQKKFVASNVGILARAFAYRKENAQVHICVYNGETVGLIFQRDWHNGETLMCIMDQFMIDKHKQRQGFGTAVLDIWLNGIKALNKYTAVQICCLESDTAALRLYKKFGFYEIEKEEDEIILQKDL